MNSLLPKVLPAALVIFLSVLLSGPVVARDLFRAVITLDGQTGVNSTNSLGNVTDLFDETALSALFPTADYVPGFTAFSVALDLRGVASSVSYLEDSGNLRFKVPVAGIDLDFFAATRDLSEAEFEDWLKGNGVQSGTSEESVTALLRAFVKGSPVDPVAGNPNSLQSRMFQNDFGLGSLGPFLGDFPADADTPPSLWKLDLDFGYFAAGPYDGQTYDFDIAFGWQLSRRLALVTDLGMTFSVDEGEALAGIGNFGLGLQGRISDGWNLALVVRGGVAGSIDVGAVGAMVSVSLVNHMRFDFSQYRLEMSNMVGVASSIDGIEIEDIRLDYDNLTNVVLKNGFSLHRDLGQVVGSRSLRARLFLTDTLFFGDDLWLEHSDEIGLGIGMASKSGIRTYDPVALDLSYVFGTDYDALKLRLSLRY
ncbi:MAG TPA: hypothetical protein EYG54_04070 [Myxococcales bacterium]|nr:hypothetical protein [Myxococcales bacterium]